MVFYAVLLGAATERRLFALAATVTAVGMTALALLPGRVIPDSIAGLAPALPLLGLVMVHSAGMHLAMVMEQSIVIESGGLEGAGRRLGWVAFWRTIAALIAALAILGIGRLFDVGNRPYFIAGAVLALAAAVLITAATRGQPRARGTRRRLRFERRFNRYYLLCALSACASRCSSPSLCGRWSRCTSSRSARWRCCGSCSGRGWSRSR